MTLKNRVAPYCNWLTENVQYSGECYTASQCTARGGSFTSSCAAGFGVCCYTIVTSCSGTVDISQNNTYIRNPGYAGKDREMDR